MKKRILYFDLFAGISGDMTVAALLDLGVDFEELKKALGTLGVGGFELKYYKVLKNGISASKFDVLLTNGTSPDHDHRHTQDHHHSTDEKKHSHAHTHTHDHHHNGDKEKHSHAHTHTHDHHHNGDKEKHSHTHTHEHHHRNLSVITGIINNSGLTAGVKELSLKMFEQVARAEAKVHNKSLEKIHFHEVGAVDSIVDITAAAFCINALAVDEVYASPVSIGTGFVHCAHGKIPVPAPATVEILKNVPLKSTGIEKELTTPTGAAIIKTLASSFGTMPLMTMGSTGYGAGTRDLEIPNLVRVCLGETEEQKSSSIYELETNIDDMNPELFSYLFTLLLKKGALDVYTTPIMMKKNRPAVKLSVLCRENKVADMERIIFKETTTLGIRRRSFSRTELETKKQTVTTGLGPVSLKAAYQDGVCIKAAPEYEDCRKIAEEKGVSLKTVYDAAQAAALELVGESAE